MAKEKTKKELKDIVEITPEDIEKEYKKSIEEIVTEAEEKGEGVKHEKEMSFEEKRAARGKQEQEEKIKSWKPKTQIGKDVKSGKEKDIDNILANRKKILEPEIVDSIINVETELLSIGQAKGKFGGGKRRAWRQTQKKTMEGNVLTFSAMAVVGDRNDHIGIGHGKSKETLPAREKAIRNAKLNIIKIKRGCGDFNCSCHEKHSLPFVVEGKAGSIRVKLIPAAQGTGLVIGDEGKKILKLAGVKDIYGVSKGHVRTTLNYAKAIMNALSKTTKMIK